MKLTGWIRLWIVSSVIWWLSAGLWIALNVRLGSAGSYPNYYIADYTPLVLPIVVAACAPFALLPLVFGIARATWWVRFWIVASLIWWLSAGIWMALNLQFGWRRVGDQYIPDYLSVTGPILFVFFAPIVLVLAFKVAARVVRWVLAGFNISGGRAPLALAPSSRAPAPTSSVAQPANGLQSAPAMGAEGFGSEVSCQECSAVCRTSWPKCQNCGAPANIAFLAIAKSIPVEMAAPRNPEPQVPAPSKPGFAQGAFGKAMGYCLLVITVFALLGAVSGWLRNDIPHGTSADVAGYAIGQILGVAGLLAGALRAVIDRKNRMVWDWVCAGFLLWFVAIILTGIVPAINDPLLSGGAYGILVFFSALFVLPTVIVAVRLMRRPFNKPKPNLSTSGLGF